MGDCGRSVATSTRTLPVRNEARSHGIFDILSPYKARLINRGKRTEGGSSNVKNIIDENTRELLQASGLH